MLEPGLRFFRLTSEMVAQASQHADICCAIFAVGNGYLDLHVLGEFRQVRKRHVMQWSSYQWSGPMAALVEMAPFPVSYLSHISADALFRF